jgi:predicted peptidase
MGFSMGGYGTWSLALQKPEKFAAIVPMAGGGDPEKAGQLLNLPIWAFHGDEDTVIPVEQTTKMVDAIKAAGGQKVKMTIFPNTKHGIHNLVVNRADVWEWLLEQKRE